jgi:hypothetical protein
MKSLDRRFDSTVRLESTHRADYFGLDVELVAVMPQCSAVRYRNREFIVLTEDLRSAGHLHQVVAA